MLAMTSLYRVEVFVSGSLMAEHTVEAADALAAIDLIEARYGEPPELEHKTTQHEDGTWETALVVIGWHGYTFMARKVKKLST